VVSVSLLAIGLLFHGREARGERQGVGRHVLL